MPKQKLSYRATPENLKTILTLVKHYPTRIRPAELAAKLGVPKKLMHRVAMDMELRKGKHRYTAKESKLRFRSKEDLIKVARILDYYGSIILETPVSGSLVFHCRVVVGGPLVAFWLYNTIGHGSLQPWGSGDHSSVYYVLDGVHPVQEVAKLILPYTTQRRKMWKLLLAYRPRTYGRSKAEIRAEIAAVKAIRRPHGPNAPDLSSFSGTNSKRKVDHCRHSK